MQWTLPGDDSPPVISAQKHIDSRHGGGRVGALPETCVIFEMGAALGFMEKEYKTVTLYDSLPCFLEKPKCISINGRADVCFTRGGYGAPAAVDTLETVRALGVKRVVVVGMCGGFGENINVCGVIVPHKVLCEEGTSHHYFECVDSVAPDEALFKKAKAYFSEEFDVSEEPTVTSDAFYRQTFNKEALWREKGCVGVDMESSALLSVCRYYSMPAVTILLCSDKHPMTVDARDWSWGNADFRATREAFMRKSVAFALQI